MKRGLALCGGGSLGAYEIGVWQYFREHGMDFDIITGTSIGAINGAMVASNAYEEALNMWKSVDVNSVMADGIDIDRGFLRKVDLNKDSSFSKAIDSYKKNKGANTAPLKKMLKDVIEPLHVNRSPKTLGIVICRFPSFKEEDVVVNQLKDEEVVDYLMASSACWPVFPVYEIKGRDYVDGGWRNNLPIDFALSLGAEEVVAVKLNSLPVAQHQELFDLPNVTMITPSLGQGSFLSFTHNRIEDNIRLGYIDAAKSFGSLKGNRVTLENDFHFSSLAREYFNIWMRNDPRGFLDLEKIQTKRAVLKIKDPVEKAFILSLERIMDMFGYDYRKTYKASELIAQIKEKIKTETRLDRHQERFISYLNEDKSARVIAHKELKYFASLLK